jgi:Immunity protein Imm1
MIPLVLWYSHEQADGDVVQTSDELDAALNKVAALSRPDWPVLAEVTQLENKFGPMMYVGFHVDAGALYFTDEDNPGPYFTLGTGAQDGEPLLYMYTTADNELPPNAEIPADLVRKAAHEFANTGRRPTSVEWQTWDRTDATTESEFPEI